MTVTHCHSTPPHTFEASCEPLHPLGPFSWEVGSLPSESSGLCPSPGRPPEHPPGWPAHYCCRFAEDYLSVSLLLGYTELLGTARPYPCTPPRRALSGTDPPFPACSPTFLKSRRPLSPCSVCVETGCSLNATLSPTDGETEAQWLPGLV